MYYKSEFALFLLFTLSSLVQRFFFVISGLAVATHLAVAINIVAVAFLLLLSVRNAPCRLFILQFSNLTITFVVVVFVTLFTFISNANQPHLLHVACVCYIWSFDLWYVKLFNSPLLSASSTALMLHAFLFKMYVSTIVFFFFLVWLINVF